MYFSCFHKNVRNNKGKTGPRVSERNHRPDDALRIAKEKRRRRSRPAEEEFSDLDSENFEIFYPDIIN